MKVLIAYDGSACADRAIEELKYAAFPKETEILAVTVAHEGWPSKKHSNVPHDDDEGAWKAGLKEAQFLADRAQRRIQLEFPDWKVSSEGLWGDPAKTLIKTIDHWKADVVVVGSHGHSAVGRLLLGSVSLDLVHHAPCSVRLSHSRTEGVSNPSRILVATDGSVHADAVIQEVANRRWPKSTEVRVICIVQTLVPVGAGMPSLETNTFATEPAFQVIDRSDKLELGRLKMVAEKSVARLERAGLLVNSTVIEGNPLDRIVKEAKNWNAGTVFVGARGIGALDRLLLGSVSNAAVTHAHCTVEVIRRNSADQ